MENLRRFRTTLLGGVLVLLLVLAGCSKTPDPVVESPTPIAQPSKGPLKTLSDNLIITTDVDGPDDVPLQEDVSQMGFDTSHLNEADPYYTVFFSFDDTSFPGGNSGDGCAFFDGDGDGFADFAICASFEGDPVMLTTAKLYDCKDSENAGDQGARCPFVGGGGDGSNGVIAEDTDGDGIFDIDGDGNPISLDSNVEFFNTTTADPFASDPDHLPGNCRFPPPDGNCVNEDTGIQFQIFVDELVELTGPGPTESITLTNVCSFTSLDPSSERKDCVVNAGAGFIIIEKMADPDDDTQFDFTLDGAPFASITGSGASDAEAVAGDTTYNLAEVVPDGWQLDRATCDNGNAPATLTVAAGERVTCTFENSITFVPSPGIALDKRAVDTDADGLIWNDANGNGFPDAGETVDYELEVSNTGNIPLTNISVTDPDIATITCPSGNPIPTLDVGTSEICTGSYALTQADIDAGQKLNKATADSEETDPVEDEETVTLPANAVIAIVKDVDPSEVSEPTTVTYTYTVTNPGNVSLTGVTVTDDNATPGDTEDNFNPTPVDEDADTVIDGDTDGDGELDVDETWTYTATRDITQGDIDAGTPITNVATATSNESDPATDDATVTVNAAASLAITKSADVASVNAAEEVITYTVTIDNTGMVTLTNVVVTDPLVTDLAFIGGDTDGDGALDVDEIWTYEGTYTVQQSDIDNNGIDANGNPDGDGDIDNTATVDTDQTDPQDASAVVTINQNALLGITKTVTDVDGQGPTGSVDAAGDVISYEIVATNDGNTTLTNVTVSDPLLSDLTCDPATPATLAPGESTTCTGSYTVTQGDIDGMGGGDGKIDNTATANSDQTNPVEASEDVPIMGTPDLDVVKVATDVDGDTDNIIADKAGDIINYTITVTNSGTVTLTNVTVDDDLTGTVDAPCAASLAPGASCDVMVSYEVTQADLDSNGGGDGLINNTATADSDQTDPEDASEEVPVVQSPAILLEKTGTFNDEDGDGFADVGETISYSFTVTNTGNVTLTDISLTDPSVTISGGPIASLAPGEPDSTTFTGSYTVTQADIDAGNFLNLATVCSGPTCDDDDHDEPLPQNPAIMLEKTGALDLGDNGVAMPGDVINYSFTVTNTGNVTLTSISVSDPLVGPVSCSAATLAPDASTPCTASYEITQADIDAGEVFNEATANGTPPEGDDVSDKDDHTEPIPQEPLLRIIKTGEFQDEDGDGLAQPDETISYTLTVKNDGNVTLTGVTVSDPGITVDCAGFDGTLDVMESFDCSGSYSVTQADIDAGVKNNLATADSEQTDEVTDDHKEPLPQDPAIMLEKTGVFQDENGDGFADAGETISYSFTVTNIGNVTLTNITLSDPSVTISGGPIASLAPGASDSTTFTGSYAVTQADIDAGTFLNLAEVCSGTTCDDDDHEEELPQNPALAIDKSVISVTDTNGNGLNDAGDVINYNIKVTNTGNVTLTNVTVSDPLLGGDLATGVTLNVGQDANYTGSYTITQADVDANGGGDGDIDNTATADSNETEPEDDSEEVDVDPSPAHSLDKSFTQNPVGAGETGEFTLTYTNTGNVTLTNIEITDTVEPLLAVQNVQSSGASCTDSDNNAQTVTCSVSSLAPGDSVEVTVDYLALPLADELVPNTGQTSGANYVFYFENGYVLYGSTEDGTAFLIDPDGNVSNADVEGRNQDIYFNVPFGGDGFQLHLSCSEVFIDGWGDSGPIESEDPEWRILAYEVDRFNVNGNFKDCGQIFAPFEVENVAAAEATPASGTLSPNPITASDTLTIINIAPVEVTRNRVRRGDVEIQYFNSSRDEITLEIIRVEWDDGSILESASYQDGVDLGISGGSPAQASIETVMPARSKDWLKLSFDTNRVPAGLKVIIVTSTGATFSYDYP